MLESSIFIEIWESRRKKRRGGGRAHPAETAEVRLVAGGRYRSHRLAHRMRGRKSRRESGGDRRGQIRLREVAALFPRGNHQLGYNGMCPSYNQSPGTGPAVDPYRPQSRFEHR